MAEGAGLTMAIARIHQQFTAETSICVEVEVRESYPDALSQAVAEVVRLYQLACPDEADPV